jgi:hypothetical protein
MQEFSLRKLVSAGKGVKESNEQKQVANDSGIEPPPATKEGRPIVGEIAAHCYSLGKYLARIALKNSIDWSG